MRSIERLYTRPHVVSQRNVFSQRNDGMKEKPFLKKGEGVLSSFKQSLTVQSALTPKSVKVA